MLIIPTLYCLALIMMGGINNVGKKLPTKSKFTEAPHHHLPISINKNKVYTEKKENKTFSPFYIQ